MALWSDIEEASEDDLRAVLLFQPTGKNHIYTPVQQKLQTFIFDNFSEEKIAKMQQSIMHFILYRKGMLDENNHYKVKKEYLW